MELRDAYEMVLDIGGLPDNAEIVLEMRRAFELRTGSFGPDDAWFEARSLAFWDDALTSQGFGRRFEEALSPSAREWLDPLARAHRGLFTALTDGKETLVCDAWSGAEFPILAPFDETTQDALAAATGPFDGRIVARGSPLVVSLLPGAVFHPADAAEAIEAVVAIARGRGFGRDRALDALLRMERTYRGLSRAKPAYAYRKEALETPDVASPSSAFNVREARGTDRDKSR